jgi:uncharacterized protein (DUF983 family)
VADGKPRKLNSQDRRQPISIKALVSARCPRCRRGPVFRSNLLGLIGEVNEVCPVCGLRFLRETGYFLGAMYISYGLGVLTILPVAVLLAVVLEWPLAVVLTVVVLQSLLSMPLFLRLSRLIWMHVDQAIDPR